jgi:hypothetical protein
MRAAKAARMTGRPNPILEEAGTGSAKANGARGGDLSRWEGNIVSTHRDEFVVKQDDPVIAQRRNGRAALDEFEIELEHALADLRLNIGDIVPSRYIEQNSDGEDDAGRKLKDVIVDVASGRIEDAFSDFNWPLQRALRQLRRALR